jgi:RNAse H-fold protein YqgF
VKIREERATVKSLGRLLALDVGEKRIGVAVSDELGILATPLAIVRHTNWRQDIVRILDIACQEQVVGIVVGVPYYLDGTISEQTRKVLRFVERLRSLTDLPVHEWNEALSTEVAKDLLRAARRKGRREGAHVEPRPRLSSCKRLGTSSRSS